MVKLSSYGYSKWLKHFSREDVETETAYDSILYTTNSKEQIPAHSKITVLKQEDYSSKYKVLFNGKEGYISGSYIKKPRKQKGATEHLHIRSSSLITLGEEKLVNNVIVKYFDSHEKLKNSIQIGLENNKNVCKEIIQDLDHLLTNNNIVWNCLIDRDEIDELGKYIGELLIGYIKLKNTEITGFSIPLRSNHEGFDSFFHINQDVIPVSSKYGGGSLSSFFSMFYDKNLTSDSVLRDIICDKDTPIEIVYEYGVKNILNLNYDDIYFKIKNHILDDSIEEVENEIRKQCNNEKILKNLPYSTTSFFTRELANRLNNCKISSQEINSKFRKKNIHQYHLNIKKWIEGVVDFEFVDPQQCEILIYGSKSVISDFRARHGLLSYKVIINNKKS